jgi:hypothetical protein
MESFMEFHGIPWNFMEFYEIFHEISWKKCHDKYPPNVYENSMELRLMKFHGIHTWNFMKFGFDRAITTLCSGAA